MYRPIVLLTPARTCSTKFIVCYALYLQAVARNATVGAFMVAPLVQGWYKLMAVWSKGARTSRWSLKITIAEQIIFSPVILSTFFIGSGKSIVGIIQ